MSRRLVSSSTVPPAAAMIRGVVDANASASTWPSSRRNSGSPSVRQISATVRPVMVSI